jgi:site-specific recombinase XerD
MSTTQLCEIHRILHEQLQIMATTLKPTTIIYYRAQANRFLRYLHLNYPEIQTPAQLQRNPHILGWLRSLTEENPPLANRSRRAALICMRRMLHDLADNGYPIGNALILGQDIPPRDLYLPIPVSPEVDHLLNHQLRQTDDLLSNALLLLRATGMRIGECLRLKRDSLRHLGGNHWALHVPLGKLHNERWVPMDDDARSIFERVLSLAGSVPSHTANSTSPLLLLPNGKKVSSDRMRRALLDAAKRIGCPPVRPHQLRHTFATVMLRAGISLPALKEILGHRDIRMTMGYVQVTQNDLQREYHLARQKIATVHAVPRLSIAHNPERPTSAISDICRALDALKHQLEMYRRQLSDERAQRKLHSVARRLAKLRNALAVFQEV